MELTSTSEVHLWSHAHIKHLSYDIIRATLVSLFTSPVLFSSSHIWSVAAEQIALTDELVGGTSDSEDEFKVQAQWGDMKWGQSKEKSQRQILQQITFTLFITQLLFDGRGIDNTF